MSLINNLFNRKRSFHPDLPGLAIHQYYQSGRNRRIRVYSPLFYRDSIRPSLYFRDYSHMPLVEQKALDLCRGRVLDAGAGAGSHSLWLQKKGMDVTALDHSPLSCRVMRERGLSKVVCADFFQYREGVFDSLLLMMNGIGIAGSLKGVENLLDNLPNWLSRGGRLIFDSSDLSYLYQDRKGRDLSRYDFGMPYFGEIQFRFGYRSYLGNWFTWVYVDYSKMKTLASERGYSIDKVYEAENKHYLATIRI